MELTAEIDAWAEDHEATRSEAIRRLVEIGLAAKPKRGQSSDQQKTRAREMAGKTIDVMADATSNVGDQAGRKRHLLKGPEEFRDFRVDRAQAKKK